MDSLTKKVINEDTNLQISSSLLWQIQKSEPEIKQIYGHFLPPYHMKLVKGLVAKDFNFPSAYHAISNLFQLDELYMIGEKLTPATTISRNHSIKIRAERNGAIVYTPYFNGFYMNKSAYKIMEYCYDKVSIKKISSELGYTLENVINFIAKALTLGLVNVCLEKP